MQMSKWSQPEPIPLLTMRPPEEPRNRQLQLVTTSSFTLPHDWIIDEKRRPLSNVSNPGKIDKYYIEPGTGLKFRSRAAVQRYLTEGQIETHTRRLTGGEGIKQITKCSSSFTLPDGWEVEEKPRTSSCSIDKYYIEPGTRLKFRSLAAVQRYLTEGQIETRTRRLPGGELINQITKCSSSFTLPDGWEVEEKQRTSSHVIDKTYIELGTGRRFRSLVAVERYLTGAYEDTSLKALMPANNSSLSLGSARPKMKNFCEIQSQKFVSCSLKRNISGENNRPFKLNMGSPPAKVNWVLAGLGGNMWNPIIDDSKVPDSVMQKWSDTFISTMYGGNISAPSFKF